MTLLMLALVPAIVPTTFFNWENVQPSAAQPGSSARCFFDVGFARQQYNETLCTVTPPGGKPALADGSGEDDVCRPFSFIATSSLQYAVVSAVLLVLSYLTRLVKLVQPWSSGVRVGIRNNTSRVFTRWIHAAMLRQHNITCNSTKKGRRWNLLVLKPMMALYVVGRLYADLVTSEFWDVSAPALPVAHADYRLC